MKTSYSLFLILLFNLLSTPAFTQDNKDAKSFCESSLSQDEVYTLLLHLDIAFLSENMFKDQDRVGMFKCLDTYDYEECDLGALERNNNIFITSVVAYPVRDYHDKFVHGKATLINGEIINFSTRKNYTDNLKLSRCSKLEPMID